MQTGKPRLGGIILRVVAAGLFLFATSCGYQPTEKDIYGKWRGKYKGCDLLFWFNADKSCELHFDETILVGKYEVTFSKSPGALSVRKIQWLDHGLHTIVQITDKNSMKMALFAPIRKLRPVTFGNPIYLKRVE